MSVCVANNAGEDGTMRSLRTSHHLSSVRSYSPIHDASLVLTGASDVQA